MRVSLTKSQLSTERGAELFKILCEITRDGLLTNVEIERLRSWLTQSGLNKLPAEKALLDLIERLLANGRISRDERRDLQHEIERILPPSQRTEAREARERFDAIDNSMVIERADSGEPLGEPPKGKPLTKNQQKQQALEAAIRAHKGPEGQKTSFYEINLPERLPYEGDATMKQKDYLWGLGVRDQAILDSLGKWQASAMIDQMKKQQDPYTGCILFVVLLVIIAIVVWLM